MYFSKLAVLELSGWIEEAFDVIANRAVKRRVKSSKFEKLAKSAIKRNHGFRYDDNFLDMMAKLIGLPECEQLERYLDSDGSLTILTSELDALVNQRRVAAHVALAHTTVGFDSPSVSLGRLQTIHPIVKGHVQLVLLNRKGAELIVAREAGLRADGKWNVHGPRPREFVICHHWTRIEGKTPK